MGGVGGEELWLLRGGEERVEVDWGDVSEVGWVWDCAECFSAPLARFGGHQSPVRRLSVNRYYFVRRRKNGGKDENQCVLVGDLQMRDQTHLRHWSTPKESL